MLTLCSICSEMQPTCLPDEDNESVCENCHDAKTRARWLADKARRERVEEAFQEQDSRLERDGCYVPYDPPTPNLHVKQAGDK